MTPPARYAAAIEILDKVYAGAPAEKTLTNWARRHRFAGSKDRAAIRDIVFECLRRARSFQARAGGTGARATVIGALINKGIKPETVFGVDQYSPEFLTPDEIDRISKQMPDLSDPVRLDYADWLDPLLTESLGDQKAIAMAAQQDRGPVCVRINTRKAEPRHCIELLAQDGIVAEQVDGFSALMVKDNARHLIRSHAFQTGLLELQDFGAQQVCDAVIPFVRGDVLDFCAGGGGKSLALADRATARFFAYDANERRLKDLPERADRAGVKIKVLRKRPDPKQGLFDCIVADVPCSGSGTWRRNPDHKWRFDANDLLDLQNVQRDILDQTAALLQDGGHLVYITCSLLNPENQDQIEAFCERHPQFLCVSSGKLPVTDLNDGFFYSILEKRRMSA